MTLMARLFPAVIFGFLLVASATAACGGGEDPETPGDRVTDPARVPSSTPIQNATLFKIQGNEVQITGGSDRKSTRLNSSHSQISYAVFCLKKKKKKKKKTDNQRQCYS